MYIITVKSFYNAIFLEQKNASAPENIANKAKVNCPQYTETVYGEKEMWKQIYKK
jgi:hypothetical protein